MGQIFLTNFIAITQTIALHFGKSISIAIALLFFGQLPMSGPIPIKQGLFANVDLNFFIRLYLDIGTYLSRYLPHNHIYLIKENQKQRNRPEYSDAYYSSWPIHLKKNSS